MGRIEDWCRRRGIRLRYVQGTWYDFEYDHDTRTITLAVGRVSSHTRLYMALHECGHALQDPEVDLGRRVTRRLARLAEEVDAWARGRRLATRLGIRIDTRAWRALRARALASHVRYLFG